MKDAEKFHRTVSILVKAYLNDTLAHGACTACAVGNLVAENLNLKISNSLNWLDSKGQSICTYWDNVFMTPDGLQRINPYSYRGEAKKQIDATGYTWQELARIEFAFESAPGFTSKKMDDEVWMFNGLMAVVDVLCEIHGMDDVAKKETKALFVK